MDKIREIFTIETKIFCEKICRNKNRKKELGCDIIDCFTEKEYKDFEMGYKSRDPEIKKLKLENRLKYEEIKKLRETLQELVDECKGMISDEDIFCIERAEEVLKEIT